MRFKVISGGQTGVDQAALRTASGLNIPTGGWMPWGYCTEDGPRPLMRHQFGMRQHVSVDYAPRTAANIEWSDFTLILVRGAPGPGTLLTIRTAKGKKKPHVMMPVDYETPEEWRATVASVAERIASTPKTSPDELFTLNVAGPRESTNRGVETAAQILLAGLFTELQGIDPPRTGLHK